jgi:hypothetical protein
MNEITILNDFIIDKFDENPLVNTITILPTIDMDANKENIYPLVNIDMGDSDILEDAIIVSYKISVVQQRDVANKKTNSKLLDDTNYLDNMNETHSICAKFINYLRWQNNDENINIQEVSKIRPLKNKGKNGLDGYEFDIDLSIHNKGKA